MTSQTTGRLQLFTQYAHPEIRREDDSLIAEVMPSLLSDARRLVACWNACDGVETDLLEQYPAPFTQLRTERDHFQSLAKDNGQAIIKTACELGEVKTQRDALLAALILMEEAYCSDDYSTREGRAKGRVALIAARAAIAQAMP